MGHNDYIEDDSPVLPQEAGFLGEKGFEPDDAWLSKAGADMQCEAMRFWFKSRYCDPANETPYDGEEGGYLYVYGGPYDAHDELSERFGGQVSDELIQKVVEEVEADGVTEWAPIHTDPPDYDTEFEILSDARSDPYNFFLRRLTEIDKLMDGVEGAQLKSSLRPLLFSALIGSLESYLAELTTFWVVADETVYRRFVFHCEEFKQRKLSLAEIFVRMDVLKDEVEKYLQQQVWHRLDKVTPLMTLSLGIKIPDIGPLMKFILVRHDIVHRGGKTKEGKPVLVTGEALASLRAEIVQFVEAIESQLTECFPGAMGVDF